MKKIIIPAIRRLSVLALFACFFIPPFYPVEVQACAICVPYPEKTLADRLLENDEIIFAREIQDSPYVFSPVETIRGVAASTPIRMFCDSPTRRKLRFLPDSVVVLARENREGTWQLIAFADRTYQSFIQAIVQNGSDWADRSGNRARLDFFSQFLTSEHPLIQEQAYLEVGRAPYSTIKILAPGISREQIYQFLGNFRFIEWHSLYILFLGQSRHPEDRAYVRKHVESAVHLGLKTNLAAWLTAFIEAYPETGLEEVVTWYFSNTGRSRDELEQVLTSMSVLGSQQSITDLPYSPLRDKIVDNYATLLANYPEMAGRVARDLAMWQVRAHVERLSEIQEKKLLADPSDIYQLDYYLSMAGNYPRLDSGRMK